ncbi:MAG: two-component regulator propeller domain-containing protein [Oscillospiraceae bacterium]
MKSGNKLKRLSYTLLIMMLIACAMVTTAFAVQSGALTNRIQILYNDSTGLPTSEANTVLQTQDGYIWIGSYGGLIRYDGNEYLNFGIQEGTLFDTGVRTLFEDSKGNLWVGTNNNGVYHYENDDFTLCNRPKKTQFSSIRCFVESPKGIVFVGSSTGIAYIDDKNCLIPVNVPELENQTVYDLSFDKNGVLWGISGEGIAFALKGDTLVYWFSPGDLDENENYSVVANDNRVFIGTSGTVLIQLVFFDDSYNENSYKIRTFSTETVETTNALFITKNGELWLGADTGAAWFDKDMQLHILPDVHEQNTFINDIAEDYEGNLWLSSKRSGVIQVATGKFFTANKTARLEGKPINAFMRIGNQFYVASNNGLSIISENWTPIENYLTNMLNGTRVRHIMADSNNNIWISTYGDYALICYTPKTGEIISITKLDGLLDNKIREVIELKNGDIAVATTSGLNILRDTRVIKSYGQKDGLVNPTILSLLEAPDGSILVGSDGKGIYVIKDEKITNLNEENTGIPGVVMRIQADDKAGGAWIGAGNGLYFMERDGSIREIKNFRCGVGNVLDIKVAEDDIWILKSNGVFVVPRDELVNDNALTVTEYGTESGLSANISANSWSLFEDGTLYLCTMDGVSVIDSKNLPRNNIPPKTIIKDITIMRDGIDTTVYKNPKEISIPKDARRVTIHFACLSFGTSPCTIEYYLQGFDEQPIILPSNNSGSVSYTNLGSGKYAFHLSAKNADGVAEKAESLVEINKQGWLYEQRAVRLGTVVLLLVIGLIVGRITTRVKTRRLSQRQREYKVITDQALKTIANTIDAKDKYTNGHSMRVAKYSRELARRLGLSSDEQEHVYYAGLLHDIGKIGIPDAILNKPGKLTDDEFALMREHTLIGSEILKDFTAVPYIGEGALSHHENFCGDGYPEKKKYKEIPLVAKIIRVADSYDAMSTSRAYRDSMSTEYVLGELKKYSGKQFEPHIAELMCEMIENGFTCENNEPQDKKDKKQK